jgi:hypothetical protein
MPVLLLFWVYSGIVKVSSHPANVRASRNDEREAVADAEAAMRNEAPWRGHADDCGEPAFLSEQRNHFGGIVNLRHAQAARIR